VDERTLCGTVVRTRDEEGTVDEQREWAGAQPDDVAVAMVLAEACERYPLLVVCELCHGEMDLQVTDVDWVRARLDGCCAACGDEVGFRLPLDENFWQRVTTERQEGWYTDPQQQFPAERTDTQWDDDAAVMFLAETCERYPLLAVCETCQGEMELQVADADRVGASLDGYCTTCGDEVEFRVPVDEGFWLRLTTECQAGWYADRQQQYQAAADGLPVVSTDDLLDVHAALVRRTTVDDVLAFLD